MIATRRARSRMSVATFSVPNNISVKLVQSMVVEVLQSESSESSHGDNK